LIVAQLKPLQFVILSKAKDLATGSQALLDDRLRFAQDDMTEADNQTGMSS